MTVIAFIMINSNYHISIYFLITFVPK